MAGDARAAQLCENSDRETDADDGNGREAYDGKHTQGADGNVRERGADGNIRERGADGHGRRNVRVPAIGACLGVAAYLSTA